MIVEFKLNLIKKHCPNDFSIDPIKMQAQCYLAFLNELILMKGGQMAVTLIEATVMFCFKPSLQKRFIGTHDQKTHY